MDGGQRALRPSLQRQLAFGLTLAVLAVAAAAGALAFWSSYREANELQDAQLLQIARLTDRNRLPLGEDKLPLDPGTDTDPESQIIVQRLASGVGGMALPVDLPDGLQTRAVRGESWRIYVRTLDAQHRIAVAQRTSVRDEVARDAALRTVAPLLVLAPILLVLMQVLLRRGFGPLARLAQELDRRGEQSLQPVADTGVPREALPFVQAINRLLARVAQAMAVQRRFVADAAHELRTPLTALSLQAERLDALGLPEPAAERLRALHGGLQRTRQLVQQLLTLARMQQAPALPAQPVLVQRVFQRVVEDLLPLAEARRIDIGVSGDAQVPLRVDETALVVLVKNLVDNALRYTPEGGRVDLSARRDVQGVTLQVDDTGPGIPEAARERVFDAFYRGLGEDTEGSGLGLSIVRTISEQMGAVVSLADAGGPPGAPGLRVQVRFPAQ